VNAVVDNLVLGFEFKNSL